MQPTFIAFPRNGKLRFYSKLTLHNLSLLRPESQRALSEMSKAASNKAGPRSTASEMPVPASEAHPSQRWEAAFVYAFICKFTHLRKNVEGFESPME
jgi:hypothetical protein